jgi:cell division septation protein DedD
VQVAALPDRNDAVALAAQLERKDYGAVQISTTQIPGKGTMYRVRIGHFATREEANAFRQEFERKERKSAFVTPAK